MEFSLKARVQDRASVVCVAGELDVATAGQLGDLLTEVVHAGSDRVFLDLGGVTFMDCAALAVLLRAREASTVAGGGLCLLAVPRCVRRLLALTGTLCLAASPGAWCAEASF
jgi:anti-sigma B factor antagonist